jgi:S1-C subfamily serine protease
LSAIVKRIESSNVIILTYDKEGKLLSQGSSFFINQDGNVVTSRHVILNAVRAEVKTAQAKVYPIRGVVAEDKEGDIIQVSVDIPRKDVKPLSVSVSLPEVGERIIVIGSPLGLERTATDAIVSAVREVSGFGKIIQISASVSPGSSGSPVVNMEGKVIGVATFQLIEGQNLNFAIPGERVAKLKPDKRKTLAEWQSQTIGEGLASAEVLYYAGLSLLLIEDYDKALSYFKKAVEKNHATLRPIFILGIAMANSGAIQKQYKPTSRQSA